MTLDVSLVVALKGVDLVASTAFLTLTDKMDFRGRLAGIQRLDVYRFAIETPEAPAAVAAVRRALAVQSTFYNRNKHNYLLEFRWDGGQDSEGVSAGDIDGLLVDDVKRRREVEVSQDLNGKPKRDRVIFKHAPVYRVEVLVEDREDAAKTALARKLESDFALTPVTVSVMGTCWHLAVYAEGEEEARHLAEAIVVTRRRDRGLLLNPNDQRFTIQSLQVMNPSGQ